ncbi:MAG: hypothetical protein ACI9LG_002526 [Moritella dasanensis]|jgi:hypothetical protein
MKLTVCQLEQLLQLATEAALKAGKFINSVDRSSLQVNNKQAVQQGLELQVIKTNGAVMNAIGVLENPPACYVKLPKPQLGGVSLWDFSATAAITQALSDQYLASSSQVYCTVSDYHGSDLDLNRNDSNYMNHKGVLYSNGLAHHVLISPKI